jgi:hypothetical protein
VMMATRRALPWEENCRTARQIENPARPGSAPGDAGAFAPTMGEQGPGWDWSGVDIRFSRVGAVLPRAAASVKVSDDTELFGKSSTGGNPSGVDELRIAVPWQLFSLANAAVGAALRASQDQYGLSHARGQ